MNHHIRTGKSSKDMKSERYSDYSINILLRIHNHMKGKSPQEKYFSPQLFSVKSSMMPNLQLKLLGGRAVITSCLKRQATPPTPI